MPIKLDDMKSVKNTKVFSPKFFDSSITGSGKKTGLLAEFRNPVHTMKGRTTSNYAIEGRKRKVVNGDTTTSIFPVNPFTPDRWRLMTEITYPDLPYMTKIGKMKNSNGEIYAHVTLHSIVKTEIASKLQGGGTSTSAEICYQLFLYTINDAQNPKAHLHGSKTRDNCYQYDFTSNLPETLQDILQTDFHQSVADIDIKAVNNFIDNISCYDVACRRSEEWQTTIDKTFSDFFQNILSQSTRKPNPEEFILQWAERPLRRLENYNVPLDLYRNIYNDITAKFPQNIAQTLCKQNLNLLLSDTLNNLNLNKPNLHHLTVPNPPQNVNMSLRRFSPEQIKAITSCEPLVLVQAGAGTGKSTVILGRIEYMCAVGVNPADITVLSFTNAAADHITDKNPNVHSMTIARMIHTIYEKNFPNHILSSVDTIYNSINIYYPPNITRDDTVDEFQRCIRAIIKNDNDAFTRMNNFVEQNFDKVMKILDTIKQTSLELEIIICYQKIETLQEPPEVQSKYLIIDEVQDNSIFEFVYALKYVEKHNESLFIVGDCSQTLYEFRASNPKALNIMEGSGVFAAYQLQVNYRSNQEILDFANVALKNIEANQYANIQLRANSLAKVTATSFQDKVHFHYERLNKIGSFNDVLPIMLGTKARPFIDDKLQHNEQIAFLAFTRDNIYKIQKWLEQNYPGKTIVNLMPERMNNSTWFSQFISRYWDDVKFIPSQNIMTTIIQEIYSRLPYLVRGDHQKVLPNVQKACMGWRQQYQALIDTWFNQYSNGQITKDEFLDLVKDNMLQYEISTNAIKQSLISTRNEKAKQQQAAAGANFILSTIHSAKGLEFENTVVLYRNDNQMAEDKKRMYYVAFTRAMKSELILAYDTVGSPQLEADYKTIVETLKNQRAASQPNKVTPATTNDSSDDEPENTNTADGDDE